MKNIVQEKSFQFALEIVKLYQNLKKQNEFAISKQLLRSGTSIGANVEEGSAAQTKKDFITAAKTIAAITDPKEKETVYKITIIK